MSYMQQNILPFGFVPLALALSLPLHLSLLSNFSSPGRFPSTKLGSELISTHLLPYNLMDSIGPFNLKIPPVDPGSTRLTNCHTIELTHGRSLRLTSWMWLVRTHRILRLWDVKALRQRTIQILLALWFKCSGKVSISLKRSGKIERIKGANLGLNNVRSKRGMVCTPFTKLLHMSLGHISKTTICGCTGNGIDIASISYVTRHRVILAREDAGFVHRAYSPQCLRAPDVPAQFAVRDAQVGIPSGHGLRGPCCSHKIPRKEWWGFVCTGVMMARRCRNIWYVH